MEDFWKDAQVISTYTRQQAIEDGVLADMDDGALKGLPKEAGFRLPVAMTSQAFNQTVAYLDGSELPAGQDPKGRAWDVLNMLRWAISRDKAQGESEIMFTVIVAHDKGRPWERNEKRSHDLGRSHRETTLKAIMGAGDHGEPVMTLMQPWED